MTRALRHVHDRYEMAWSLTGPLIVLLSCSKCIDVEVFRPRKRLRKVPFGIAQERFDALCELSTDELRLGAFREAIQSATPEQHDQAIRERKVPRIPAAI